MISDRRNFVRTIALAAVAGPPLPKLFAQADQPEQIEDLVDIALTECERFYPAFQLVVWGGKGAEDAIAAAMIDPQGEA